MSAWTDAVDAGVKDWEQRADDQVMAAPRGHVTSLLQQALPHLIKPLRELAKEARVKGEQASSSALVELHLAGRAYTGMCERIEKLLDQIESEAKR